MLRLFINTNQCFKLDLNSGVDMPFNGNFERHSLNFGGNFKNTKERICHNLNFCNSLLCIIMLHYIFIISIHITFTVSIQYSTLLFQIKCNIITATNKITGYEVNCFLKSNLQEENHYNIKTCQNHPLIKSLLFYISSF